MRANSSACDTGVRQDLPTLDILRPPGGETPFSDAPSVLSPPPSATASEDPRIDSSALHMDMDMDKDMEAVAGPASAAGITRGGGGIKQGMAASILAICSRIER